jgi:polysaccharide export outer membrane protein
MNREKLAGIGTAVLLTVGAFSSPAPVRAAADTAPQATAPAVPATAEEERVEPFDTLDVSVLQLDSLKRTVEVNSVGVISLPLAGDFNVAGKTTRQIAAEIAERLGRHDLQDPQVTVTLQDANQGTVSLKDAARRGFTVEGSVILPGVYSIYGPTTLLQGLAMAHGPDQYANDKGVMIYREVNGRSDGVAYNLADIRRGKVEDPPIYPQDLIVVTGSKTKRWVRDFAPLIPLLYLAPKL